MAKIFMTRFLNGSDYLFDSLFHGLRSIPEIELVDYPRLWYMYADEYGPGKIDLHSMYGRGFTLYGTIKDDTVDRSDIEYKIKNDYFDRLLISADTYGIYGKMAYDHANPEKIVWIDGSDSWGAPLCPHQYIKDAVYNLAGIKWYFKRELIYPIPGILPIGFSFPKEKIPQQIPKTRSVAYCDPRDKSTYIYKTEEDYYNGYGESLFAVTTKKAGWDSMRHYEIMAANCIPWFLDIDQMPDTTCTFLPKAELKTVNQLLTTTNPNKFMTDTTQWTELNALIQNTFINHCTTDKMAQYVLSKIIT